MTKLVIGFAAVGVGIALAAAGAVGPSQHRSRPAGLPSGSTPTSRPIQASANAPASALAVLLKPLPLPLPSTTVGRDISIPLCEYDTDVDSFAWLINSYDENWTIWSCQAESNGAFTGQCGWDAQEPCPAKSDQGAVRPAASHYRVFPALQGEAQAYGDDVHWTNGSAIYGALGVECRRAVPNQCNDQLVRARVKGRWIQGVPNQGVLFEVDGGIVQHLEPALVRGTVSIQYAEADPKPWCQKCHHPGANDIELAIQAQGDDGEWFDIQTTPATSTTSMTKLTVQTYVEPLTSVRFQVRGKGPAEYHFYYAIDDARIFVETCVNDENNPGHCVE